MIPYHVRWSSIKSVRREESNFRFNLQNKSKRYPNVCTTKYLRKLSRSRTPCLVSISYVGNECIIPTRQKNVVKSNSGGQFKSRVNSTFWFFNHNVLYYTVHLFVF